MHIVCILYPQPPSFYWLVEAHLHCLMMMNGSRFTLIHKTVFTGKAFVAGAARWNTEADSLLCLLITCVVYSMVQVVKITTRIYDCSAHLAWHGHHLLLKSSQPGSNLKSDQVLLVSEPKCKCTEVTVKKRTLMISAKHTLACCTNSFQMWQVKLLWHCVD